jgi:hypothetical protein
MSEFNHIFILIIILSLLVIGMSIYGPVYKMIESFQNKPEEKTPEIPINIDASPVSSDIPVVPTLPKVAVITPNPSLMAKPATTKSANSKSTVPITLTTTQTAVSNGKATPLPVSSASSVIPPESTEEKPTEAKAEIVPAPKLIAPTPVAKEVKPAPKRLDISESSQTRFMPKTMLQPSYVPSDEIISAKQPVQQIVEQPTEQPIQKQDKSKLLSIFKFNF